MLLESDRAKSEILDRADDDKVIPWAEGNGLWAVISKLVDDLVEVDIITFFVQNPYACDSAEGVAERIGRQVILVQSALEELASADLLEMVDLADVRVYELTEDSHRRQTLQQYVTWLQEGYHWARMVMDR